jgi:hypothetical protein
MEVDPAEGLERCRRSGIQRGALGRIFESHHWISTGVPDHRQSHARSCTVRSSQPQLLKEIVGTQVEPFLEIGFGECGDRFNIGRIVPEPFGEAPQFRPPLVQLRKRHIAAAGVFARNLENSTDRPRR